MPMVGTTNQQMTMKWVSLILHHDVRQLPRLSRPEIIGVVNQLEGGATEFIQWT
jgi:hypothetical protein